MRESDLGSVMLPRSVAFWAGITLHSGEESKVCLWITKKSEKGRDDFGSGKKGKMRGMAASGQNTGKRELLPVMQKSGKGHGCGAVKTEKEECGYLLCKSGKRENAVLIVQ